MTIICCNRSPVSGLVEGLANFMTLGFSNNFTGTTHRSIFIKIFAKKTDSVIFILENRTRFSIRVIDFLFTDFLAIFLGEFHGKRSVFKILTIISSSIDLGMQLARWVKMPDRTYAGSFFVANLKFQRSFWIMRTKTTVRNILRPIAAQQGATHQKE